jgi:hypothetical protein
MLAAFGWAILVIIMLLVSAVWIVYAWHDLGQYTSFGGIPNTIWDKIGVWFIFILVCFGWKLIYDISPFTLTLTQ